MAITGSAAVLFHSMGPDRTPAEVAALRAVATEHRERSDYDRICCGATLATLDWIAGTGPAPATGDTYAADADTIVTEQLRAQDIEAQGVGHGDAHIYPGVVAQTLRWYRRYERTLAPVL